MTRQQLHLSWIAAGTILLASIVGGQRSTSAFSLAQTMSDAPTLIGRVAPSLPTKTAVSPTQSAGATPLVNEPPIVLQIGGKQIYSGDLWEWIGQGQALKQLTNWHYNFDPVLSPDGIQVTYRSLPQFVVQDLTQNGGRSGFPPTNIWALDLKTGNAVRIADQPPNAGYGASQVSYILRPTPAWSPDSKRLAWIEGIGYSASGAMLYNLVSYDVATQTTQFTAKNPPSYQLPSEGLSDQSVSWSSAGIGYIVAGGTDYNNNPVPNVLYVFDSHGNQLTSVNLPDGQLCYYDSFDKTVLWAMADAHPEAVFCLSNKNDRTDYVFDPADKSVKPLSQVGQLQMVSANASGSIAVEASYDKNGNRTWTLPGTLVTLNSQMTLSPDGKYIADITGDTQNQITLYDKQGTATPIDLALADGQQINWLGWGPVTFRIVRPGAGNG